MIIRQSTARTILVGPVLDSTGAAKTDEVVGNIKVTKNGTVGAADGSATLTHDHAGKYKLALTANDCDTIGVLEISLNSGTNDMPVKACNVVETAIWDALFADGATGLLPANVTQFGGTNLTAASGIPEVKVASIANDAITAAAIADGAIDTATFAAGTTIPQVTLVDTCTTNADMRGTDNALLAGSYVAPDNNGIADVLTRLPDAAPGAEDGLPVLNADLKVAAALDSAVADQITAIETFATRVTTGIVQDGAVWQFTANMLELGPSGTGGGASVNVLPATGIVADRSAGTTLTPVIGETISQSITVYQSDGTTAVDLSGKTLKVIFETMSGTDVAVVESANITISGTDDNVVTFAYPAAVTASERTLRFAIRDAAAPLTMYLQGVCSVVAAPKVDA